MKVEEVRSGRSWRLYEGGAEMGVVLVARVRSSRRMYAAYSARDGRWRWDLGVSTS
ncbi:MAG: hypothetical protein HY996_03850 [Micrococcales bacterium]|nr:hypothetical protein [Micrococcales bacterium]